MGDTNMAVKIEDISSVKKKLSFEVPWNIVKEEVDNVYRDLNKTAKIKGFRQGKIPRNILEKYYGEQISGETAVNVVNRIYWDALKEHNINAVTQPEIDQKGVEIGKDFAFTATVEVEPDIDPAGYTGLQLEKEEVEVTEADVNARLDRIRQMFATLEELQDDRGVKEGDYTSLDFQGTLDGNALKELKADNYFLEVGSKMFVPGFEEQLIGMKSGESREIKVCFPADYRAEHLAGKEVVFSVTVKNIKEKKLPEVDDNFIKNFERYANIEELRDDLRKTLGEEKEAAAESNLRKAIVDKLLDANKYEVPPSFIERQTFFMMSDTQRRMVDRGTDAKTAAEYSFKLYDKYKEEAERIVKTVLILKNIARKESISVSDEEVEEKIKSIAAERHQEYDNIKKSLQDDDMLENIRIDMINEKVYDLIKCRANITLVKAAMPSIEEGDK